MATITVFDVIDLTETNLDPKAILIFIKMVDAADSCLDTQGLTDDQIKGLKLFCVAHLVTLSEGGQVKSETDMDGASASYSVPTGTGFDSTTYGMMAKTLAGFDCISTLFDKPRRFAGSVG